MSLKTRIIFWSVFIMVLFIGVFGLIEGMPEVMADSPLPPTIDQHLQAINNNMQIIKLSAWAITGLLGLLGAAITYIFKSTVSNVKGAIYHVEKNLKEDIDRHEEKINRMETFCREKHG